MTRTLTSPTLPHASAGPKALDRLARSMLVRRLAQLSTGRLSLRDDERHADFGTPGADLCARLAVHDPRFYRSVVFGGHLGAAASFIRGDWSCDDLTALLRIFARQLELSDTMDRGPARFVTGPLARAYHALRPNSRTGSRRNIAEHYDLGNDFFAAFLDPTMTYSCAVFDRPGMTLADAQRAKYDRLAEKLGLNERDRVVEIGGGWGGFALHAARTRGCHVSTTTISRAQHDEAARRIAAAGLEPRIDLRLCDYRDLTGRYDKLVSIEMIEAIGWRQYGTFFRRCAELLRPGGLAGIQAITIADQRYDQARRTVDFIKRFVFPGSCIPSVTAMGRAMTAASDLRLVHLEDLTPHYAETLRRWRRRLFDHARELRAAGYPERLLRLWDFYLSYCEAGFEERTIGLVQMVLARPGRPGATPAAE